MFVPDMSNIGQVISQGNTDTASKEHISISIPHVQVQGATAAEYDQSAT